MARHAQITTCSFTSSFQIVFPQVNSHYVGKLFAISSKVICGGIADALQL